MTQMFFVWLCDLRHKGEKNLQIESAPESRSIEPTGLYANGWKMPPFHAPACVKYKFPTVQIQYSGRSNF